MKGFLLTLAILAFVSNLGDCAPNKDKKVTFKDTLDLIDPPDVPDGIFIMNYKKFDENVREKYKLYDTKSKENRFIQFLSVVVEKTYLMWDQMYRAVNLFDSYAVILTQTKRVFRGETLFPDPKTFGRLENYKKQFNASLATLLGSIEPAYEINESLIPLIDRMNRNTKIDMNILKQMFGDVKNVIGISNDFDDAFQYAFSLRPIEFFTTILKDSVVKMPVKKDSGEKEGRKQNVMKMYRKSLSDLRVMVIELENNRIPLLTAMAELRKNVEMLDKKIYPEIEKSLHYAKPINFTKLHEAMRRIQTLARKALNVEGASSSK